RGRRGRGACVGGEVRGGRGLLVSDRGDDRHWAAGDRTQEALIAEREEVFETATTSGQDDDVDLGRFRDRLQGVGDREGGARALDVRLSDEQQRRRKARGDRGDHVLLRGGVVAGDEPDAARQPRERALSAPVEETSAGGGRLLAPRARGGWGGERR